jgi:type 1 glutamine amidotransferase
MSLTHRNVGRRGFIGIAGAAALATAAGPAAADDVARRPHRVVVFTRTAGFRHNSITVAISTLKQLGAENGIEVVATEDPAFFTPEQLRSLTAIVFANTTGNVLTGPGRAAIEEFVTAGGGWMGVHAAADTEYDWPFYTELLSGGRFLCHPLLNQRGTIVRESATHVSTAHLPKRWTIPTEE